MRKSSFLLNIPLPKFTLFFAKCTPHSTFAKCTPHSTFVKCTPSLKICEIHSSLNICEMHPSLNICEAHIDWNEKRKLLIRQLCGYQAHGLYCTLYVLCTLKQAVGLWWGVPVVAHYIHPPPPKKIAHFLFDILKAWLA